jgi:lysophospholipase L1-like esterase
VTTDTHEPHALPTDAGSSDVRLSDVSSAGLRRLWAIAATCAALGALSYAVPHTQRLRPWSPDEGLPIARMYTDGEDSVLPGFAEASTQTGNRVAGSHVEAKLGAAVARSLSAEPGRSAAPVGPATRIEPSEYEGLTQHVEHPEALSAFFAKLAKVARGEGGPVRVAHYGDSAVAADSITSTARRSLQRRFGDAGHGFVLISRGMMHYMHKDIVTRASDGWEVESIVQLGLRPGYYGYGGVRARGGGGLSASFGTVKDGELGRAVSRFEIFYQRQRGGGPLELKLDGRRLELLQTHGDKLEDAFHVIEVEDGPHMLSLRPLGSAVNLYGVALERERPGVVYDSLGLVGAVAERLLGAEPAHLAAQLAHRDPDLLVLAFGGNESANSYLNIDQYEKEQTQVVRRMRSGRASLPCMLFAPLDQGERDARGRVKTVPVLPKIVGAQRRVAEREGCAFFDAFSAMGGEGSMATWVSAHPRLATSDMRHATPAGYEVIGDLYYKALLEAFARYLERVAR